MPSQQYFDKCPPFPPDVPVVDLPTTDLSLLEAGDDAESTKLFQASCQHGFFALDLRDSDQGMLLDKSAEGMFDLADQTLNLPKTTLDQYACKPPKDLMGYKQAGIMKTEDGKVDAIEVYTLSQDEILGNVQAREQPEPIRRRQKECCDFFQRAYGVVAVIVDALDLRLGLPVGTLAQISAPGRDSATSSRFLLTRPQESDAKRIAFGGHTDIGLITLLFNVAGGLQILPAECESTDENWRYVRPQPHHAIVNLGDTLVELTGGVVRSSLHRVVTAPGEQAKVERNSLAYLVRPARDEKMRRLKGDGRVIPVQEGVEGEELSVDDWATQQALNVMRGIVKPRTNGGLMMKVQ